MSACPQCSATVLPDQSECKACGQQVPGPGPEQPDPQEGRLIAGNFRLDELIGEGSMGRVYSARQLSLDKRVAIKVLHPHLAADPKVTRRFHREARAASRLSHPNSLQIIDFGEDDDGTLYIAMELLDGPDLLEVIEEDFPLTPARIGRLLGQVLSALGEAHHAGIIHRDLKPENVVVVEAHTGDEHIKVCDFGIAKIQEAEGGSAITVSGFVCGTPEFMAPEQARGEALDARADVYAAGCMLYQMLTGEMPFRAESALGIITRHLTEAPVPPSRRRVDLLVPRELERVCLRAMRKDRRERYSSAGEMKSALDRAVRSLGRAAEEAPALRPADGQTQDAGPLPDPIPRRFVVPGLLAAGAAVLGLALVLGRKAETSGDEPAHEVAGAPPIERELASRAPRAKSAESSDPARMDHAPSSGADRKAGQVPDAGPESAPPGAVDETGTWGALPQGPTSQGPTQGAPGPETGRAREDGAGGAAPAQPSRRATGTPRPEHPGDSLFAEGRQRFLAHDVAGAIERFEQAARHMPGNAGVHKELGRAYMRRGEVRRAVAAYRRYLQLAPDAPDRPFVEQIIRQEGSP